MKAVVRKRRINQALATNIVSASRAIHVLLDQRFLEIQRELKAQGLNKIADPTLEKIDWANWTYKFASGIRAVLSPVVDDVSQIEQDYWSDKGREVYKASVDEVIRAYEARVGRQISDIGEATRNDTLQIVTDWYNSPDDVPFEDLVDRLQSVYSAERADAIARTETSFISSQVTLDSMEQLGIKKWIPDIGREACIAICIPIADGGPYTINDRTPPFHTHCDCGMLYLDDENLYKEFDPGEPRNSQGEWTAGGGGARGGIGGIGAGALGLKTDAAIPGVMRTKGTAAREAPKQGQMGQQDPPVGFEPRPGVGGVGPGALGLKTDKAPAALPGRGERGGGSYGHLKQTAQPGHEIHHMPAYDASPLNPNHGPAIIMTEEDHFNTASYGNSDSARKYRAEQRKLIIQGKFKEAQKMDFDDLHAKFGSKYDDSIKQAEEYTSKLKFSKKNNAPMNPTPKMVREIRKK